MALRDPSGKRIEALANVIHEVAPPGAPPSEELFATIGVLLANPEEGTQYASAKEWMDALAQYVDILNNQMLLSAEETRTVVAKYTEPITSGEDTVLAAYVEASMSEMLGG